MRLHDRMCVLPEAQGSKEAKETVPEPVRVVAPLNYAWACNGVGVHRERWREPLHGLVSAALVLTLNWIIALTLLACSLETS